MTEAIAHAEHLRTLLREASAYLADGKSIPGDLWAKIEEIAESMEKALPR